MPDPNPDRPIDPALLWAETLTRLRGQMTRAAFNAHLQGTTLAVGDERTVTVRARSPLSADWLAGRLKGLLERALAESLARPVTVHIEPPPPAGPPASAPNPAAPLPFAGQVDFQALLWARDWIPLPAYYTTFWQPYLGGRAFSLWLTLAAQDRRDIKDPAFNPWTEPATVHLRQLGRLLSLTPTAIGGTWQTCARVPPGGGCCGRCPTTRLHPAGDGRCQYYRPGLLDRLQAEGLAAVGRSRSAARLQVWRLLPLLTPAQVAQLPPALQRAHRLWLKQRAGPGRFTLAEWEALRVPSLAPHLPGYAARRPLADSGETPPAPPDSPETPVTPLSRP